MTGAAFSGITMIQNVSEAAISMYHTGFIYAVVVVVVCYILGVRQYKRTPVIVKPQGTAIVGYRCVEEAI